MAPLNFGIGSQLKLGRNLPKLDVSCEVSIEWKYIKWRQCKSLSEVNVFLQIFLGELVFIWKFGFGKKINGKLKNIFDVVSSENPLRNAQTFLKNWSRRTLRAFAAANLMEIMESLLGEKFFSDIGLEQGSF